MKTFSLTVHNYLGHMGVDCYWEGEFAGESSDPRCTLLEDEVIGFIDACREKAGWPDDFLLSDTDVENLKWFIKVRADRIFKDIDIDVAMSVNIYSSKP